MYNLNNACNNVLEALPDVKFTGDAVSKRKAIEAWAYWWKGYAYSRIGSMYYAGIINNKTFGVTPSYVTHDAIIAESNKNLDLAMTALTAVTNPAEFKKIIAKVIPDFVQTGKGGAPTPSMWMHTINTQKARNLLANKQVSMMTTADWNTILTLTGNGLTKSDNVFTARTTAINGFISTTGNVAAMSTGNTATFRISERLIQEYKTGDKRLANNFSVRSSPLFDQTGGVTFSTRYALIDKSLGLPGVQVISDRTPGNFELYIGPTYEESDLMRAEAFIYTNQIEAGLKLIDAVRANNGAGLADVAGTSLTQADAIKELRRE